MTRLRRPTPQTTWALTNLQAITERLTPIQTQPDGTLYAEQHGPNFIVVTKTFQQIRLWILDPGESDSGVVQSEMALENPLHLVDPYTQAAILGLGWVPNPRRIYCAGLGAGRVPMILHHHLPAATIDCTEIDPAVLEMATRFFGLGVDERLQVHIADGRQWLEGAAPYDFIFVDVFLDRGYVPYRMSTVEFFTLCQQRLTPEGVLVVNLLSEDEHLVNRIATLQQVFGQLGERLWACPLSAGNILFFASNRPVDSGTRSHAERTSKREALLQRIIAIQEEQHFAFPLATRALDLTGERDAIERHIGNDLVDAASFRDTAFHDTAPPPSYFDLLPSFADLPTAGDPALPCPCGSGLCYGACHGAQ